VSSAAVVAVDKPTSTALYKILISLKARWRHCPQPASVSVKCNHPGRRGPQRGGHSGRLPRTAAINWMTTVTIEGTQELMKAPRRSR